MRMERRLNWIGVKQANKKIGPFHSCAIRLFQIYVLYDFAGFDIVSYSLDDFAVFGLVCYYEAHLLHSCPVRRRGRSILVARSHLPKHFQSLVKILLNLSDLL